MLSGSIEPLAMLSHNGELEKAGAIVIADFDVKMIKNALSSNDIKSLFDVRGGGSIESKRWHTIEFPVRTPRLFSLNGSVDQWLGILGMDGHTKAQMRRVCVAGYSEPIPDTVRLVTERAREMLRDTEIEEAQEELERERQW